MDPPTAAACRGAFQLPTTKPELLALLEVLLQLVHRVAARRLRVRVPVVDRKVLPKYDALRAPRMRLWGPKTDDEEVRAHASVVGRVVALTEGHDEVALGEDGCAVGSELRVVFVGELEQRSCGHVELLLRGEQRGVEILEWDDEQMLRGDVGDVVLHVEVARECGVDEARVVVL